ncbi:hypothetical protein KFK09_018209 [Dendrobium nobile]|uniref:Uncharacterized protein n=1 Tax=Dendrobium nobile TaxID=94219 RepID=A0A8T3AV78_DENNO|nr:hypothetical protein KFK09_018209 [Dendrobium nobile]
MASPKYSQPFHSRPPSPFHHPAIPVSLVSLNPPSFLPFMSIVTSMSSSLPPTKNAMASNKERLWSRAWRGAKTLFFVVNMLASLLLVCAPPLLVILLDLLLPSALLAAANRPAFYTAPSLSFQLRTFQIQDSLIDLPVISIARSILILCFYLCCNGWGPYLGVTTVCGIGSVGYVSLKAIMMFGPEALRGQRRLLMFGAKEGPAIEALFLSSMALAMAHVVAAYRTSCRERRKLLVYKLDIEAVYELIKPIALLSEFYLEEI